MFSSVAFARSIPSRHSHTKLTGLDSLHITLRPAFSLSTLNDFRYLDHPRLGIGPFSGYPSRFILDQLNDVLEIPTGKQQLRPAHME
jgi:hypothetical protein